MSSLFSDPSWRRGGTLLSGEPIELDASSNPIAGRELIGQVKIFQDVNPNTGAVNSARLVYCVAARYTGSGNIASADIGKAFVFSDSAPLSEFSTRADDDDVDGATGGKAIGVLDEYISEDVTIRPNDIVWLVVKGPTSIKKSAVGLNSGVSVALSATANSGLVGAAADQTSAIGQALETVVSGDSSVRINLVSRHV